jgi:hypothetical protein
VRFYYDEDGSLMIHAKLPPEVGAVVKKALEAALEVLKDGERGRAAENADTDKPAENVSAETIFWRLGCLRSTVACG